MNLSMKWLADYVTLSKNITEHDFAEALTMSGSKVEGYRRENEEIRGVVIGKITAIEQHPDAEKLIVCTLDVGAEETLQIVTGAKNVKVNDIVPVATDGSLLPGGVKIKRSKLRGVESRGMLCSIGELGVTTGDFPGADPEGILIIDEQVTLGADATKELGIDDTIVEFEITSNRPDCLSVIGLARETAATFDLPLTVKMPELKQSGGNADDVLDVQVHSDLCSRYMARVVENVKIGPSPRWMRERLRASGVRPINNIVDITNYVMLEYGHPMHAFDMRYVEGNKINVRTAAADETITTLDGVMHKLSTDMLVIADGKKPVGVAGVMGGEYSGVMPDTACVVFESACFHPYSVRATAQKLGLRTDSSARFEKGLNPHSCSSALDRACELVDMLGCGMVLNGVIDCKAGLTENDKIPLNPGKINAFLGTDILAADMEGYLTRLGLTVSDGLVEVPYWRIDLKCEADIAEEIARIYGYKNIPTTAIRGSAAGGLTPEQQTARELNEKLTATGYSEIVTYSFIGPKAYDKICLPADSPLRNSVKISNPLGADTSIMRTSALPSMCEALSLNYNNRNATACLFELATVYMPKQPDELPDEQRILVMGAYGAGIDFYSVKGAVMSVLSALGISGVCARPLSDNPSYHPGRTAELLVGERVVGTIGELLPDVCENHRIGGRVYAAELDFAALHELRPSDIAYRPLPKFPSIRRDFALLCDDETTCEQLRQAIVRGAGRICEGVELFDVYTGGNLGDNKKSLAFSVTLRAADRTLTDEEADRASNKILKELEKEGVSLRS